MFKLLILLGFFIFDSTFSFAQSAGPTEPVIELSGLSMLRLYQGSQFKERIGNASNVSFKIDRVQFDGPFTFVSGCKGQTLKPGQSCEVSINYKSAEYPPSTYIMTLVINGQSYSYQQFFSLIEHPYAYQILKEQTSNDKNPSDATLFFPDALVATSTEAAEIQIKNVHNQKLKIKSIQAPSYFQVSGCVGTSLGTSGLAAFCDVKIKYQPKKDSDTGGVLNIIFTDDQNEYPLAFNLKAQVWKPLLQVQKVESTDDGHFILLKDHTLWRNGPTVSWTLVMDHVDDFFAGPDHGLVIRKNKQLFAKSAAGYGARYGLDEKKQNDQWQVMADDAQKAFVTDRTTFFWNTAGELFYVGQNLAGYGAETTSKWRRIPEDFVSIDHDDNAAFGIKSNHQVFALGGYTEVQNDGMGYPKRFSEWTKIEQNQSKYLACGSSFLKLGADGVLQVKGNNFSGELGLSKVGAVNKWTKAAQDVRDVITNCGRIGIPHHLKNTYIIKKDGSLWGQGDNYYQQLGLKTKKDSVLKWQLIAKDVASISADSYVLLILKKDETVWATGSHRFDLMTMNFSSVNLLMPLGDFRRH